MQEDQEEIQVLSGLPETRDQEVSKDREVMQDLRVFRAFRVSGEISDRKVILAVKVQKVIWDQWDLPEIPDLQDLSAQKVILVPRDQEVFRE